MSEILTAKQVEEYRYFRGQWTLANSHEALRAKLAAAEERVVDLETERTMIIEQCKDHERRIGLRHFETKVEVERLREYASELKAERDELQAERDAECRDAKLQLETKEFLYVAMDSHVAQGKALQDRLASIDQENARLREALKVMIDDFESAELTHGKSPWTEHILKRGYDALLKVSEILKENRL